MRGSIQVIKNLNKTISIFLVFNKHVFMCDFDTFNVFTLVVWYKIKPFGHVGITNRCSHNFKVATIILVCKYKKFIIMIRYLIFNASNILCKMNRSFGSTSVFFFQTEIIHIGCFDTFFVNEHIIVIF